MRLKIRCDQKSYKILEFGKQLNKGLFCCWRIDTATAAAGTIRVDSSLVLAMVAVDAGRESRRSSSLAHPKASVLFLTLFQANASQFLCMQLCRHSICRTMTLEIEQWRT